MPERRGEVEREDKRGENPEGAVEIRIRDEVRGEECGGRRSGDDCGVTAGEDSAGVNIEVALIVVETPKAG